MATYTDEVNVYNPEAVADGISEALDEAVSTASTDATSKANAAAKTATNYITADSTGIKIHDASDTMNYQHQTSSGTDIYVDGKRRTSTSADGLEVFDEDGETSLAKFGSTARVGTESGPHMLLSSGDVRAVFPFVSAFTALTAFGLQKDGGLRLLSTGGSVMTWSQAAETGDDAGMQAWVDTHWSDGMSFNWQNQETGAQRLNLLKVGIDGAVVGGSYNYATCGTEAATAPKVVTCPNFRLMAGSRVTVKFTYSNTAASPTLNVNGTGAQYIRCGSSKAAGAGAMWNAGDVVEFVYDGAFWQIQNRHAVLNTNTGTGAITLSVTAANYNHMRIYFGSGATTTNVASVDVYSPNGKTVSLNTTFMANSTTAQTAFGLVTISGTSITRTNHGYVNVDTSGNSVAGTTNQIYISRVEAWSE